MEAPFMEHLRSDHWSFGMLPPLSAGERSHVVFAHYGIIEPPVKEGLIRRMEEQSLAFSDAPTLRKRLFNVLCEGMDNLALHTESDSRLSCFVLLIRQEEAYRLYLGNHVPASIAQMLLHRIEVLDAMSEADIRECFLKLLASDGRTNAGGAGLGLLTMARKSDRMHAHVARMSESHAQMIIELRLGKL